MSTIFKIQSVILVLVTATMFWTTHQRNELTKTCTRLVAACEDAQRIAKDFKSLCEKSEENANMAYEAASLFKASSELWKALYESCRAREPMANTTNIFYRTNLNSFL